MTNLPKALRDELRKHYSLTALELVRKQGARDTTQKFLWRLSDHSLIESVLIPANPALYGEASDRHTLCVSTQVGCAYGCKFCASGLAGWKRNLRVEEIVEPGAGGRALERSGGKARVQSPKSKVQSQATGAEPEPDPDPDHATRNTQHESPIANRQSANPQPSTSPGQQPGDHGHGRAAGELRQSAQGAEDPECALGRGHRRAQDHDFHQRPGAANPQAGGRAAAIPAGDFPARRDGRDAQQDHAGQPQVSPRAS